MPLLGVIVSEFSDDPYLTESQHRRVTDGRTDGIAMAIERCSISYSYAPARAGQ